LNLISPSGKSRTSSRSFFAGIDPVELLVEAKGSRVTITATDLELSVALPAKQKSRRRRGDDSSKEAPGAFDFCRERRNQIQAAGNHWVEIVSDKKKYKLVGMAKKISQRCGDAARDVRFPLPRSKALIGKTKFAISMEGRATAQRRIAHLEAGHGRDVATDGHRLALAENRIKSSRLEWRSKVLVPKKA